MIFLSGHIHFSPAGRVDPGPESCTGADIVFNRVLTNNKKATLLPMIFL